MAIPMRKNMALLLKQLGEPYRAEIIDGENCVCLDVGPYQMEVSWGNHNQWFVFVWLMRPYVTTIETYQFINYTYIEMAQEVRRITQRMEQNLPSFEHPLSFVNGVEHATVLNYDARRIFFKEHPEAKK